MSYQLSAGNPYPLGATWEKGGANFALFSQSAEKVELCLYDASGQKETARIVLPEYNDQIWHGHVAGLEPGQLYGYRVYGPYNPDKGERFNHHKLLIDPYARALSGPLVWDDALFAYQVGHEDEDYSFDERDSGPFIPKARLVKPFEPRRERRSRKSLSGSVIYEAHLKGFTQLHPDVPEKVRGTFAGVATEAVVGYIKDLGVTTLELLPIHAFIRDRFLVEKNLTNYWGYNSIAFLAPDPSYVGEGGLDEVKGCFETFQRAGLQIFLDVVYNHTAEGNHLGPTLSFKGIDNAAYYRLTAENPRFYYDTTGCGNTLNVYHPRVLQLVMDSLRYWSGEMGVDGFRFDLAPTLGRENPGYENNGGFFRAVRQDPALADVMMVAEPWDIGEYGYQLGGFPSGWSEWNGKYRDDLRSFWKGDKGQLQELAARLTGSADIFNWRSRETEASVNFITAHDGFTLADVVSYNDPHNEANQEQSGHEDNRSWNCGAEGPTDNTDVLGLRARQQRNFLASLIFSQGVPMILAGDEISHSQQGNNNAFCQDNEITWINWSLSEEQKSLHDFVRSALKLRREHPALRRRLYLKGDESGDLVWLTPGAQPMNEGDWAPQNECLGMMFTDDSGEERMIMLLNAHYEDIPFTLPDHSGGDWRRLMDTAVGIGEQDAAFKAKEEYRLQSHSLVLFKAEGKG